MQERDFALILGISYRNYNSMKNKGQRTKILKAKEITECKKQEIQTELRNKGYANKLISYVEFLELYEAYKQEMKETDFALILGISYRNYNNMKYSGTRTNILKTGEITKDRKEEIQIDLRSKGYTNKLICYVEFLELYEPYKQEMKETDFALILGISYSNYNGMKNAEKRAKILKTGEITKDRKEEIQTELRNKRYANKFISYAEFLELYEPYKLEMKETDFALILGISYANYSTIKTKKQMARINFEYEIQEKIKHIFSESQYYSLQYIEQVSVKYGITVDRILEYLFNNNEYACDMNKKVLYSKGQLFIGHQRLGKDFIDKYIEQISSDSHKYSKILGSKLHTLAYSEDIAQDVLIRAVEIKGDLTENFNDKDALSILKRWISSAIKHEHLSRLRVKRFKSLDAHIGDKEYETRYSRISTGENVHKKVEEKLDKEEQQELNAIPIELIKQCLEYGMDRTNAIKYCMKQLHLTQSELLQVMKDYLQTKGNIKTDSKGNVYLEKYEEDRG